MGWIALALQILAQLPKLLKIAEKAFDEEPDSGAQKKRDGFNNSKNNCYRCTW